MKLLFKKILKYFGRERCFCKHCGMDVEFDFDIPDDLYEKACDGLELKNTPVLCFYCFGEGLRLKEKHSSGQLRINVPVKLILHYV